MRGTFYANNMIAVVLRLTEHKFRNALSFGKLHRSCVSIEWGQMRGAKYRAGFSLNRALFRKGHTKT